MACKVKAFLDRPLEGDWPYLWIDATYVKARRQDCRVVSVAVIIAVGVNADGRREVLGMDVGPSEAEIFRVSFRRCRGRMTTASTSPPDFLSSATIKLTVSVAVPLVIPRRKGQTHQLAKDVTIAGRRYVLPLCRNEEEAEQGCRGQGRHPRRSRTQARPG